MEEYRPNSFKSKESPSDPITEKRVEKVVTGGVKTRKKSDIQKFADVFISEDVHNVKSYILMGVLVPAIKKAVSDIVGNGINMILYGDTDRSKRSTNASRVSYRDYYNRTNDRVESERPRARATYNYDDIVLDNRGEAEDVLDRMDEIMSMYKMVRVADLYEMVGITGDYTDNDYGWTDITSAKVVPVRDGFWIKMPRAIPLKK